MNNINSHLIAALRIDIEDYCAKYLDTYLEPTNEVTTWMSLIAIVNDNTDFNVRLVITENLTLQYDGVGGRGLDVMEALGRAMEIMDDELNEQQ